MKTLNMIGCGNVGKTLGRLWVQTHVFKVQDILNRSNASSIAAVDFVQAGHVVRSVADMRPADVYMLGVSDQDIATCCEALLAANILQDGNIVFHCSGALPSSVLSALHATGAYIASIHPIKSFANPALCVHSFAGTFCGTEGDAEALDVLNNAFQTIGGQLITIDAAHKTFYHGAGVVVSNYLTALLEVGIQSYVKAGLSRSQAISIIAPIATGTIQNIASLDTALALTGPIARGDVQTVATQLTAFQQWQPEYGELYRLLGGVALELSKQKGVADEVGLVGLKILLEK